MLNILLITNLLALISLIYISVFNTYRIDYVDGELLVNPEKSIYLTYVVYGYALGAINGALICRRYFYYDPKEIRVKKKKRNGCKRLESICLGQIRLV